MNKKSADLQIITPDYPSFSRFFQVGLQDFLERPFYGIGDQRILTTPLLGFFCSSKCPGTVILKTYDFVRELRDAGIPVISGFHASMERECLDLLLRGKQPIVICPGRSLDGIRLPKPWKIALDHNRLFVLSCFGSHQRRLTSDTAQLRNRLAATIAAYQFIPHASPGSKTEHLCHSLLKTGSPVFTFELPENLALLKAGAKPITVDSLVKLLKQSDQKNIPVRSTA